MERRMPRRKWALGLALAGLALHGGSVTATTATSPGGTGTAAPLSADATEHWLTPSDGSSPLACGSDAASRWQTPDIAPADLPYTADAAEHWLTPEIGVGDLPHTADAAEHWLCHAP